MHVNTVLPLACVTFLMDEALLSISPTGRGQLVEMFITLESNGIFESNFAYVFNVVQPLVCNTVTRLLGESKL